MVNHNELIKRLTLKIMDADLFKQIPCNRENVHHYQIIQISLNQINVSADNKATHLLNKWFKIKYLS